MFKFLITSLFLINASFQFCQAVIIDCERPPKLVDPASCCLDGGRDEIMETCAQRMGLTGPPSDKPPSVETATCLAECILKEAKYLSETETLDFEAIETNLHSKFSNDTIYADTMTAAFQKCQPHAQMKLKAFRQIPLGAATLQKVCNPFSSIVLGCTYMEYFKNCPQHRWTENAECNLAKQFVMQCSLPA